MWLLITVVIWGSGHIELPLVALHNSLEDCRDAKFLQMTGPRIEPRAANELVYCVTVEGPTP
jgi:hypothetical protein